MNALAGLDWIIVAAYFALVFGVAIFASRGGDRDTGGSSEDYFLAGRNSGWFIIGGSLFASNIGAEHLVGLAGTGATSGVAVGQFEILASLILLLLGWLFVPYYLRSGVYTMPEFLERRYSPAARWYLAVISIIGYVLTKISVTVAAGGLVCESLMGINFWVGATIIVVATGIYTIFGGLRAVLYTDLMQLGVLIGGAATVVFIGLSKVGGWDVLWAEAGPGFHDIFKPMSDPNFPWTGIVLGAPILGVWYWCTDQFIVQRVLSGKTATDARRGTLFGSFLKLFALFLFVVPGVIAYVLAKRGTIELGSPDAALPTLVQSLLPIGLRGLVVAGLLAALMSSLSSVFNSCSTLVTWDVYKKLRPEASDKQLVRVGQVATVALTVLGLLWMPLMRNVSDQLYTYLQSVQAYIAPPIAAVFLLGLIWPRLNAKGALAALYLGFVVGAARLICELSKAHLDGLLYRFATINFLHFAALLFVLCSIVLALVSLASEAPERGFDQGESAERVNAEVRVGRRLDLIVSLGLAAAVGGLWLYFS